MIDPYRFARAINATPENVITGAGFYMNAMNPATLFTNDAGTTPVTTAGQTVRAFKDSGQNAKDARTDTNANKYQIDANGVSYLDMPADGPHFRATAAFTASETTSIVAFYPRSVASANVLGMDDSGARLQRAYLSSGTLFWEFIDPTGPVVATVNGGAITANTPVVIAARYGTTSQQVRVNGTQTGSATANVTLAGGAHRSYSLGAAYLDTTNEGQGAKLDGRFYAALVVAALLSDADLSAIENYFKQQLQIT